MCTTAVEDEGKTTGRLYIGDLHLHTIYTLQFNRLNAVCHFETCSHSNIVFCLDSSVHIATFVRKWGKEVTAV